MEFHTPALVVAILLLATMLMMRRRRGMPTRATVRRDHLDSVADWPPTSVRVMTVAERQSYELLRKALPGMMVLAQVPLSRFIRVPTRHSYSEWMQRVGSLSADLVLCDSGSKVLAVVDVRSVGETDRARKRHDRLARVLKQAGVKVYTWREDEVPSMAQLRALVGAELERQAGVVRAPASAPTTSRPMPLIPVPEIEEVLAAGDLASYDASMEPVPSGFYADMEATPAARR
jgi:Protein of unknown function (DUF2726)